MGAEVFHAGERAVQQRAGSRQRMADVGARVIRDAMPTQHADFFEQLPFVVVGSVDAGGQPWASLLAAPAGFMQCPDPRHLVVRAQPVAGDPLAAHLREGAPLGLLGIEPHTRRRNRLNGTVLGVREAGFVVQVAQSFGNCPKYIQAREPVFAARGTARPVLHETARLDAAARRIVAGADTLFIATSHAGVDAGAGDDPPSSRGVDVSHRGGKAGFVRIDGDHTLTVPDFPGNLFFNTLGNITVHPRAGLLFADFDSGDLLQVAVQASIVWDGAEVASFAGAQRLLRLRITAVRRLEGAMALRWGAAELSPVLAATGAWD